MPTLQQILSAATAMVMALSAQVGNLNQRAAVVTYPTGAISLLTAQTPVNANVSDGPTTNYELGMKFQSNSAGQILGIRFYKASSETGAHTGRIWSSTGTQLASVVFSGETASGWQEQLLATPLNISANTTYVVTVNTANSYFATNPNGLQNQITNGSLSSVVGSNGVYGSVGAFPTNTWNGSNYFRDVIFTTDTAVPPSSDATSPSVPTSLSVTAVSSSQINLSWTASTDNTAVTGYKIYRNGTQINTTSGTSYSDSGLSALTNYSYTVSAYDAAGNTSSQSLSASDTTQSAPAGDTTAPSTPSNLSVTAVSSSQINLSWSASTDAVGVTGYKIYRAGTQIGTSATNSYTDSGLSASTNYSYTVSAYDAVGNTSSQSSSASATTQSSGSGIGTANLWVDTNGGACARSATAGSYNDASACSSMQAAVTAASGGDVIRIKNGTYGSQTISSAKSSMIYLYAETDGSVLVSGLSISADKITVKGVIASGTGNNRGSLSLTSTGTGTVVDGFQARRIWISGNHITVQNGEFCNGSGSASQEEDCVQVWNTSSYITFKNNVFHDWHSQYDVTYHNDFIQFYPSGTNIVFDGNKFYNGPTSNIMTGGAALTNWTIQNNYFGSVNYAGNSIVFGNSSSPCSGLIFRNNVDASGLGINNVDCSGLNPDMSGNIYPQTGSGVLYGSVTGGYNIFPVSGGSTFGSNAKRCAPMWLNGTPSVSNGYDIRLSPSDTCAKDSGNPSSYASMDSYGTTRPQGSAPDAGAFEVIGGVTPPSDTTVPSTPSNLSVTAVSSSQINLTWSASSDNTAVTGYDIYRGGTLLTSVTGTSYSNTGLTASTQYIYTVRAKDAVGNTSSQSSSASATTQAAAVPSSTTFTASQRVQANPGTGSNLNVRSTASATGTLLGTQANGALGNIVSGGQSVDGYYWWNVNFDSGVDGYAAENYLTVYNTSSTPIAGDFNSDGLVNSIDLSLLTSYWNQNNSTYDLNHDGIINSLDYVIMVQNWTL